MSMEYDNGEDVAGMPADFRPGMKIPYVKEGTPDTLLSASRANQIIAAYNKFANLTVGPGLRITWGDAGPVISLDETA